MKTPEFVPVPKHELPKELTRLRQEGWRWKEYKQCKSIVIKLTGVKRCGPTSSSL